MGPVLQEGWHSTVIVGLALNTFILNCIVPSLIGCKDTEVFNRTQPSKERGHSKQIKVHNRELYS